MDVVDETLRQWRTSEAIYGQTDCMLSIGRYLARTGHEDVTGQFLGRYDTAEGAQAEMARHGGVPGLLRLAGAIPKTDPPERGDVVEVILGSDRIGGLCTGGAVALRLERGVFEPRLGIFAIAGVWHGCRR